MEEKNRCPLDMFVNTMYVMILGVDILQNEIDKELRKSKEKFNREKRLAYNRFMKCMQDAWHWYEKFGVTESVWEASNRNVSVYDSVRADANELLREILLYIDRSHTNTGFQSIFRFLRQLPEQGLFTSDDIARFEFARPWVVGVGDRVDTKFGKGTISVKGNNNSWVINMDDGTQRVLEEKELKQI